MPRPRRAVPSDVMPLILAIAVLIFGTEAATSILASELNSPPVLSGVPDSATIPELVTYTFTASATDPDVPPQTLTFSLVGAPTGASINASSGVFTWKPTEAQGPGIYPFTVRVTDGVDNTDAAISITVEESAQIHGLKYNDLGHDGHLDPGDLPIKDWTIQLRGPLPNSTMTVLQTATTDANGNFSFTNVPPRTHLVGGGGAAKPLG